MARYLQNKDVFRKYKVLPEFDVNTHDVPRDKYGNINPTFDDLYIPCAGGAKIYHWGQRELVAYIPSLRKGNRVKDLIWTIVRDVETTDNEMLFHFDVSYLERVARVLGAKCNRKDKNGEYIWHSPFASCNLPKSKVKSIEPEKMKAYKEITNNLNRNDLLAVWHITTRFLSKYAAKKLGVDDIKSEMKRQKLGRYRKEFIDQNGLWDEYLSYLRKELKKK